MISFSGTVIIFVSKQIPVASLVSKSRKTKNSKSQSPFTVRSMRTMQPNIPASNAPIVTPWIQKKSLVSLVVCRSTRLVLRLQSSVNSGIVSSAGVIFNAAVLVCAIKQNIQSPHDDQNKKPCRSIVSSRVLLLCQSKDNVIRRFFVPFYNENTLFTNYNFAKV